MKTSSWQKELLNKLFTYPAVQEEEASEPYSLIHTPILMQSEKIDLGGNT
jgi:hypothetical protein